MNVGLTEVSWLDWKLGARLLLKYPALTIIGGLSLAELDVVSARFAADQLTADLLVSSVITSLIMAAVGVLACAAPARRALGIQPTEALRQV